MQQRIWNTLVLIFTTGLLTYSYAQVRITPEGIGNGTETAMNSNEIEFQEGIFQGEIDLLPDGRLGFLAGPGGGTLPSGLDDYQINLTQTGRLGVGTTAPAAKLHVQTPGSGNESLARFQYSSTAVGASPLLAYSLIEVIDQGNFFDYNFRPNAPGCFGPASDVVYNLGTADHPWTEINTFSLIEIICLFQYPEDDKQAISSPLDRLRRIETFEVKADKKNTVYGVDIEQLEEAFPGLVTRDTEGNIGVKFTRFAPIFVQAFKEQQASLEQKDQRIADLEDRLTKIEALLAGQSEDETPVILNGDRASLEQNIPNPFRGVTRIGYFLPEGTQRATLLVHDMQGRELQRIPLQNTGRGQLDLQTRNLTAGTYSYSLYVDGALIDSRKMVVEQ